MAYTASFDEVAEHPGHGQHPAAFRSDAWTASTQWGPPQLTSNGYEWTTWAQISHAAQRQMP